jgi:hypothetical protein
VVFSKNILEARLTSEAQNANITQLRNQLGFKRLNRSAGRRAVKWNISDQDMKRQHPGFSPATRPLLSGVLHRRRLQKKIYTTQSCLTSGRYEANI